MDLMTLDSQAAAGRALQKMFFTLSIKKDRASKTEQYAARKAFRDAAAFLKQAGCPKSERDQILKPYQLAYDPHHRTR
jgi:hypothetical protein